jgi:hypothetical protein
VVIAQGGALEANQPAGAAFRDREVLLEMPNGCPAPCRLHQFFTSNSFSI